MAKRKKGNSLEKVGSVSFILGVIFAVLVGLFSPQGALSAGLVSLLVLLGLLVGLLNVTDSETMPFLAASVSILLVSAFGNDPLKSVVVIGPYLSAIFTALIAFIVPAIIVVALKGIYDIAKA